MGGFVDRLMLRATVLALGFLYFRLTVPSVWGAVGLAAALCVLVSYMIGRRWPLIRRDETARFRLNLLRPERAPAMAFYGALYMALYLWRGQLIYLPLSLTMLFSAGMGQRGKTG